MRSYKEEISKVVKQHNNFDECNVIDYKNEYGDEAFVELHSIHVDGVWLDGEFGISDLEILAKALRKIQEGGGYK